MFQEFVVQGGESEGHGGDKDLVGSKLLERSGVLLCRPIGYVAMWISGARWIQGGCEKGILINLLG